MKRVYIGTSGWVYKEWANDFYKGLKAKEHFAFYATQFLTVEINATFYRLPALSMVQGWNGKAPKDFIFAVKGSRYITHIKRLNNLERSVANFIRRVRPLKEKLGPLLWQLPPNFKPDLPRLEKFLRRLPKDLHRDQAKAGRNVYVYFNNDLNVRAPNNAKLLMDLCGEFAVRPS
jgi:uncharacterized protein YecE (DUF72 family)